MAKNLDLFNLQTAKIFALLLETFPVPRSVPYTDFGIDVNWVYFDAPTDSPECVELKNHRCVLDGTFMFLKENGYLGFQQSTDGYLNVRLTEKALAILGQKPESLKGDETIGDKITDAVKDGTTSVIAGLITNVLSRGVSLLTS